MQMKALEMLRKISSISHSRDIFKGAKFSRRGNYFQI
jgi:hypothetical protein